MQIWITSQFWICSNYLEWKEAYTVLHRHFFWNLLLGFNLWIIRKIFSSLKKSMHVSPHMHHKCLRVNTSQLLLLLGGFYYHFLVDYWMCNKIVFFVNLAPLLCFLKRWKKPQHNAGFDLSEASAKRFYLTTGAAWKGDGRSLIYSDSNIRGKQQWVGGDFIQKGSCCLPCPNLSMSNTVGNIMESCSPPASTHPGRNPKTQSCRRTENVGSGEGSGRKGRGRESGTGR